MKIKKMMLLIFIPGTHYLWWAGLILISLRCDTTEPPHSKASLSLTLEDVSCTEAWLRLQSTNLQIPNSIVLTQNNQARLTINLTTTDTLLYIDSLLPNQTYKFQSVILRKESFGQPFNQSSVSSNELSATTLDTTSHNFTWQTFTFGEHSSSVLYDVAIIDENNIWAVGEIYMKDSLGNPDPHAYNAVHWDGSEWELKRIYFPTVCGSTSLSSYPAKAIFAFDDGQIWISSSGDKIAILKNNVQINKFCLPSNVSMSINKLWGSSSNDLYAVGNGGNIAHYNGTSWTKIESGTALNINDIWGDYNEKTGEWEILAVASNKYFNEGNKLIMIDGSSSLKLNSNGLPWSLSSIWLKAGRLYFVAGDGLFSKKLLSDNKWIKDTLFVPIYKDRIRGHSFNDIIVSGSNGLISHFNGIGWKHYFNNEIPSFSGRLLSCYYFDKIIVAVGWKNTQSIIIIGKK